MIFNNNFYFILCYVFITAKAKTFIVEASNILDKANNETKLLENDLYYVYPEKVDVKLYYETLCPDCIKFDTEQLRPAVEKLNQFLDIHTYPYGNAETIEQDGKVTFKCQHGARECYGNKLHACAIDHLQNITKAVLFNICMMDYKNGSSDTAADKCAASMDLDSEPIKTCAKGPRGTELLQYYGEESEKANFDYVPYILINGKVNDGENFLKDICKEFKEIPPPCLSSRV